MSVSDYRDAFNAEYVTANKTLAAKDSGIVQVVNDDATITLPATTAAATLTIQVGLKDDGTTPEVTIAPNSADGITGNGFTAAVDKSVSNTDGNYGDLLVLRGTGTTGATGWVVEQSIGNWERAD